MDNRQPASTQSKTNMSGFDAALPLSKIVYDWAKERQVSVPEIIREFQQCIYIGTHSFSSGWTIGGWKGYEADKCPPQIIDDIVSGKILEIFPRGFFTRTGETTPESLKNAMQFLVHRGGLGLPGPAYATETFQSAWKLLDEPFPDTEPPHLKRMLDEFMVKREDFERWIDYHGKDKPRFWFAEEETTEGEEKTKREKIIELEQGNRADAKAYVEQAQNAKTHRGKIGLELKDRYKILGTEAYDLIWPDRKVAGKGKQTIGAAKRNYLKREIDKFKAQRP